MSLILTGGFRLDFIMVPFLKLEETPSVLIRKVTPSVLIRKVKT